MTSESSTALRPRELLSSEQRQAVRWLIDHPGAALFLSMGFGKTIVTLTAVSDLRDDRFEIRRTLVVAPKMVAQTVWHTEAARWAHTASLKIGVCVGSPKQRHAVVDDPSVSVVVVNVENLPWLIELYGLDGFDCIVIDEASMFKDPSSKRFKALRRALGDHRVIALTGTPVGNKVENLWPILYMLDKGERLLRTISAFRQTYMRPDKTNGHVVYSWRLRDGAFDQILQKIGDICMSTPAKTVIETVERVHVVDLPQTTIDMMRGMAADLVASEGITAASAGVASNKLLQMSSGAVLDDERRVRHLHRAKLDYLKGMLETVDEPVVVVYWYKAERELLLAELEGAVDFEGPVQEAAWNRGEIPVLLLHPQKGGHGVNLQHGGSQMIWYTLTWSLELYQQTCARLPRPGQQHTVYIHHLVARSTIDEEVIAALRDRSVTQQRVIDAVARVAGLVQSVPV